MNKSAVITLLLLAFTSPLFAANGMEETMFASGKIYTFLAVAFIVLLGIFGYLFRLDNRLSKLEKEIENQQD